MGRLAEKGRLRVLLELAVEVALLGLAAHRAHTFPGIDQLFLALVFVLSGPAYRRWLALAGRARPQPLVLTVMELATLAAVAALGVSPLLLTLGALPCSVLAWLPGLGDESRTARASWSDELLLVGLALATFAVATLMTGSLASPALAMAAALALEATLFRAPRDAASAGKRAAGFALAGGSALFASYARGDNVQASANVLLLLASGAAILASITLVLRLMARRDPELVFLARLLALVLILHLARRGPAPALAIAYMLTLVVALAHGIPRVLGSPRAAALAPRTVLLLAGLLLLQPTRDRTTVESSPDVVRFPGAQARAYHELAPPSDWRGRGQVFVYAWLEGDPVDLVAARPLMSLDGRSLDLALVSSAKAVTSFRAPLPDAALTGSPLLFAFGFEQPTPAVGLRSFAYYAGSLDRTPSLYSADGTPPAPGLALTRRWRGPLAVLAGGARYEEPRLELAPGTPPGRGRYGVELWLVGPKDEVVATCY